MYIEAIFLQKNRIAKFSFSFHFFNSLLIFNLCLKYKLSNAMAKNITIRKRHKNASFCLSMFLPCHLKISATFFTKKVFIFSFCFFTYLCSCQNQKTVKYVNCSISPLFTWIPNVSVSFCPSYKVVFNVIVFHIWLIVLHNSPLKYLCTGSRT